MAEQKRENDGGQSKAFRPKPGGDAYEDALGYAGAIIATVREPLLVLEADLRVRSANRSFYQTFRVRPDETEGRLLYDLGNRQWDIPALRTLLGEILPNNTVFNDFEVEHDFPDIGRKVMLLNARKLYREGNHAELILLAIEDVTALREAERARRDAEARFTEMVKHVRDHSIFLTDPEGVITSWNVAAERIIGYAEAEAVGRHFSLIFTPEDVRDGVPGHELRQAREQGRAEDERWHVKKDGTRFWALGIVTPLHDASGRLSGFSKVLRDMTAWKTSDEALRGRERQLQFVTDHAPVLIAHCGADLRYKFVNVPYAQRFGLHPRDIIGQRIPDVLGREAFALLRPHVEAVLAGRRVEFEADLPYQGIGTQAMRIAYEPERDDGGGVVGFVAAIQNVSDRKRAEQELAASRRRLQAVFDTSLDAILLADDQARFVDANPAACDLLGQGHEEILHRGVFDITPPPNGEAGRAAWAAFVRDGRQSGEYEVSRKDGTTAVVEYRAVANVQPGLHLSVLRDVSERKRTEEALRTNERRFKTLADSAPVGIFETDAEGNCLFVNRRWCEMAGMPPEAATGQGWANALHPEDRDRIFADWYAAAGRGREFTGEYRFRTPQGRVTWLSGSAVAVRDEAGRITGYIGTVTDITGLKRAEEQLRLRAEEVEKLMEVMPVAVWLSRDRDCRHVLGNRAGSALLRMAEGANLSKTAPEAERPTHFRVYRAGRELPPEEMPLQYAASHGVEVRGVEEDIVFADGTAIHIYGSASPLFDEAGAVRGAVAGFLDVSALRRAEVALRESEGRLRAIIDNSPSVIFVKDAQGRYLLANKACQGYSGEPPEQMIGKTDRDYLPPEFADPFRADDLRVLQTGQVARYEEEAPCYGEVRAYLTVKFPLRDADGRPYAVCGIATDITELKRADQALRVSEEQFARFMQHLPGLAWIKDTHGKYVYANEAAVNAFGKPRAELCGKTDEEVFPPATAARFRENDRKALASGAGVRVVETLEQADGVLHHSVVSKFPIPGPDGAAALVGGMAIDITEEVRTRAILEESEERLRATFEQAAVGIAHVGIDGRWQRVNQKLCDIVGYRGDELLARTFQDITHPDDLEADLAHLRRLLAGEIETYSLEKRYVRKDRSLVWINLTVSLVRSPQARPKYLISVVEDITARKEGEERLRASEERYRTLFESMDEGYCVIEMIFDPPDGVRAVDYRFLEVNPAFESQAGMRDATGRRMREFVADIEEHWLANYGRVALTGEPIRFANEYTGLNKWFEVYAFRVGGEGSRRVGVLFTDITLRKRAEDDRERLVGQLRDADRRKDEFLATLAHELRNPLAPLRNGLQVLKLAAGDAAAVEQARGMMERQMAVMVRLIDDLLDVSRITRGKLELRKERVELAAVVHSAVEGSRPVIEASGHRLTLSLPAGPVYLEADPTRLAQVFGNLLTNAAKYTERRGRITLSARCEGGEVIVSVTDSGIGIAPEHLPHVFEMFSQVDSALERSQGGLGIGLSLVRGLVEMHGGTVEARSEGLGKGSEFVVRLPVLNESPARQTEQPRGDEGGAARPRRRILVADDNRDAADSLAMILRLAGHEVHAAHDGREAVEAAAWFRPDVALLDIGMPKLNGYEACRRIREQPWGMNIVLVAITGWGQEEDKRRASEAGFDHHLTKPVDPAALEPLLATLNRA